MNCTPGRRRQRHRATPTVRSSALLIGCCSFLYIAVPSATAYATDYALGYGLNVSARHDDNIRLVATGETAISGTVTSPSFNVSATTETSSLALNTAIDIARYNDSGFNSNDVNLSGAWRAQFEKSSAGIDLAAVRDSTTSSEIRDSGRIGTTADRHEHYAIAPSYSYALTESDSIKLLANASKDQYHNNAYLGYRNWSGNIDWTHSLGERVRTILRASYSDYQSDERTQTIPVYLFIDLNGTPFYFRTGDSQLGTRTLSRSAGGMAGFDYQLSEQHSLTFLAGMSRVTTDYQLQDPGSVCSSAQLYSPYCGQQSDRGNSFNAEIDWSWTGEQNSLAMNLSKMDRPSSDGYPLDSWQIDSSWNHRLTELSRLTTSLSWGRNRISGSSNNSFISQTSNRDYGNAGISFNQALSEDWQLSAGFQFRYQNYTETDYRADSRVISLAIAYRPRASHWSR
jgi:hypothetical protein